VTGVEPTLFGSHPLTVLAAVMADFSNRVSSLEWNVLSGRRPLSARPRPPARLPRLVVRNPDHAAHLASDATNFRRRELIIFFKKHGILIRTFLNQISMMLIPHSSQQNTIPA
jgi:hypothetical protein